MKNSKKTTRCLCVNTLLFTGVGRVKTVMRRWGYLDDAQSVDCDCGEPQTMAHLLSCRLLDEACTADDLATVTERAKACARKWEKLCEGHDRRRFYYCIISMQFKMTCNNFAYSINLENKRSLTIFHQSIQNC